MNNCPKCGSLLFPGDTVCKNCGEMIANTAVQVPVSPFDNVPVQPVVSEPVAPFAPVAPAVAEIPAAPVAEIPAVPEAPLAAPMDLPVAVPETISAAPIDVPMAALEPISAPENFVPPVATSVEQDNKKEDKINISPLINNEPMKVPVANEAGLKEAQFNKIIFIVVIVVSLIAMIIMTFFAIKMFSNTEEEAVLPQMENAKEYHFNGFNMYIPDDLYAEVVDEYLYVGPLDQSWHANLVLQDGTYNVLVSNMKQIKDYFSNMGYQAGDPVEKEYGGTGFVAVEVMMGTNNVLVGLAKANGTKMFAVMYQNEKGEYDDDSLKIVGSILSSMTYTGQTFELPEGLKMNEFKNIFDLAE